MFCKNCGSEVNDNAVVCLKCGCDPRQGIKNCQSCGVDISENQIACVKCGNALVKKPKKTDLDGFYCSSDDKMILGLCGGLAHKFNFSVSGMRLIMFISMFFAVGWIYLAGFVLPNRPTKNV